MVYVCFILKTYVAPVLQVGSIVILCNFLYCLSSVECMLELLRCRRVWHFRDGASG